MAAYRKINGEMIPVTTEGHPQYYFQTKAQAEAALPTLEPGADVFVEEGSNDDILPRVQELEEDVSQIESDLTNLIKIKSYTNVTTNAWGNFNIQPPTGYIPIFVTLFSSYVPLIYQYHDSAYYCHVIEDGTSYVACANATISNVSVVFLKDVGLS